jgi:hypothetical protein
MLRFHMARMRGQLLLVTMNRSRPWIATQVQCCHSWDLHLSLKLVSADYLYLYYL